RAAEQLAPAPPPVQSIGMLDHVAGLVPEDLHALLARASFDVEDHLALEPHQARMRQIKRNGDARRDVGTEPLIRDPEMWLDAEIARGKLALEHAQGFFQPGSTQADF